MSDTTQHGFATRAIHLGYDPLDEQGALSPPLYLTATYTQDSIEAFDQIRLGERQGYVYGRTRNPTQALLEERLASLEGAEAGVVTASGMAAISATLFSLLRAGDEIVVDQIVYGTAFTLFSQGAERSACAPCSPISPAPKPWPPPSARRRAPSISKPPPTPTCAWSISRPCRPSRAAGPPPLPIVDNTFATPVLQRPLEHGADIVLHSATGGTWAVTATCWRARCWAARNTSTPSGCRACATSLAPRLALFTAFLVLRGIKTLELRAAPQRIGQESGGAVARARRGGRRVLSRPRPTPPARHRAAAAVGGRPGGLRELKGRAGCRAQAAQQPELARIAVSLGDPETLIQHPASMTHASHTAEDRERYGLSEALLRLSVGLETPEDILPTSGRA